jgi:hypothetical protein
MTAMVLSVFIFIGTHLIVTGVSLVGGNGA